MSTSSATVKLDSSGRARVEYTTTSGGDPSTLRFKVSDGSSSDTTSVSVTRGSVSATAVSTPRPTQSSGGYAIGSTVELSGAAPGTNKVYLFVTGPNLPSAGAKLSNPSVAAVTDDPDTFVSRSVSNGRWSYKWQTSGRLDAGTYTIFAVDRPANRYSLRDASYSTYTVTLGRPSMTAGISGGTSATAPPTEVSDHGSDNRGAYRNPDAGGGTEGIGSGVFRMVGCGGGRRRRRRGECVVRVCG
ncbi:MAG TPA: hypothetical protein O0X38_01565, partial [Methanocorpusculum sp.]|nr:hypothetical protein [Methanocorpusculum sp.]